MRVGGSSNLSVLRASAGLNRASEAVARSMERLATGRRIVRASDDPAGVVAVEPMKARLAEINAEIGKIDERDAYFGAREGAQSVIADQLLELQGLVLTAASRGATAAKDRGALQDQAMEVLKGLDFLATTARFRDEQILTGFGSVGLGLTGLRGAWNLVDGDLEAADRAVRGAIDAVAQSRGALGAEAKANDSRKRTLLSELEGTESARSLIEDVDFASETAAMIRNRLLVEVNALVGQTAKKAEADLVLKLLGGMAQAATPL